jgi:flagellar basal-body rod protein FlgB
MMTPVQLFDLASRQADWLSVRQAAVASNIANANVSSYQAKDVTPFEDQIKFAQVRLEATHATHVGIQRGADGAGAPPGAEMRTVGGPVVLETELAKSGQVRAGMELNTAIVSAFHRMTLMVSKG